MFQGATDIFCPVYELSCQNNGVGVGIFMILICRKEGCEKVSYEKVVGSVRRKPWFIDITNVKIILQYVCPIEYMYSITLTDDTTFFYT